MEHPMSTIDLTLHLPDPEIGTTEASLVGDLRPAFPGNDVIYGDGPGNGNGDITELVKARLTERFPAVAGRVAFDPEYSGFYAYGTVDDLDVVRSVVEALAAEVRS